MENDYNKFWKENIAKKNKRYGWFRRKRYAMWARLFSSYFLRHYPARKYYRDVASIAEGFFCDIGCGLGATVGLYKSISGNPAFGIDISMEAIRFACSEKKRLGLNDINYAVSNIFCAPFKDNIFDSVYLGQILEHILNENKALDEAQRILKPGGVLIITVPKENLLPSPYHVRTYTAQSLEAVLIPYSNNEITFHDFDRKRLAVSFRIKK